MLIPLKALRRTAPALLVPLVLVMTASTASAIPAFARKYQTSCQTCHVVFPKLNAFGEAFRLRGYRMPGETEEMVKQPPVSLGAPAYKKLWPRAVWPGETSSYVPLAVNIEMADVNASSLNDDGTTTSVKNDLQFPKEMAILGAGTLGEHLSYWTEAVLGEQPDGSVEAEIEQARIAFDSPFGPEDLFHFRIGKFPPNLVDGLKGGIFVATDAGIDSLFGYNPIGVNGGTGFGETTPSPISIPESVRGVEGYGIIKHRGLWVAGLANGIGPSPTGNFDGNNAKDVYARFDYKFGGMGLDGYTGGAPVPDKNWRDNSLRVGAFTYRGDGSNIDFGLTSEEGTPQNLRDLHFLRTGVYATVYYQDLNVFGAYLHGTDSLQLFDEAGPLGGVFEPDYHAWFVQADYLFYPWLQGSGRYETLTPGDRNVPMLKTGVLSLSALIRANVKAMIEYQRDLRQGQNHSLNALVRFAF
jgi:hypothetical protein